VGEQPPEASNSKAGLQAPWLLFMFTLLENCVLKAYEFSAVANGNWDPE